MTLPGRLSAPRSPRFFWPGVAILLPIVVLAVAGIASLAKDRAMVEAEARERAQASLNLLVPAVNESLGVALDDLEAAHLAGFEHPAALCSAWPGTGENLQRAFNLFPDDPAPVLARWRSRYPGFKLADVLPARLRFQPAGPGVLFGPNGEAPTPPPWFVELAPDSRRLWEQTRALSATGTNIATLEAAQWAFSQSTSNAEARLNAEVFLWLGRWRLERGRGWARHVKPVVDRDPAARAESGLPLSAVALADALRSARVTGFEPELQAWLAENVFVHPSLLTPALLDAYQPVARSAEWAGQNRSPQVLPLLQGMRELWPSVQRSQRLLDTLRGGAPDTNAFTNAWLDADGDRWLALLSSATNQLVAARIPPSRAVEAVPSREVRFYPRRYLQAGLTRSIQEGAWAANLPGYLGIQIELAGESLLPHSLSQSESTVTRAVLLATRESTLTWIARGYDRTGWDSPLYTRPSRPVDYPGNPQFSVSLILARPELLYAQHQRRVWWFGSLILGAAAVAIVGFALTRRAYLRQVRLNEAKSNFVASVSHELRAPIASVRLLAEGLERGAVRDEARQSEYFRLIVQECRRLSSLIENILDFSRIDQARKEYEFEPTDLGELTRQTIRLMTPYATERKVTLELAIQDEAIVVEADGKAIQQALVNLVDNAVKHSPSGAVVTVGLEALHESGLLYASGKSTPGAARVALWVKDQGPGIPPAERSRIFEAFYRLGSELRRETQGVGIGLSIVKHIVEAHHGSIRVESQAGQGSRFTIQLPVLQSDKLRKAKPC